MAKPVLLLREVTERPEGVKAGTVRIVGLSKERIFRETCKLIDNRRMYNRMAKSVNPYGDGKASKRIVDALLSYFRKKSDRYFFNVAQSKIK